MFVKCFAFKLSMQMDRLEKSIGTIPRVHLLFVPQIESSAFITDLVNHKIQRKYWFSV